MATDGGAPLGWAILGAGPVSRKFAIDLAAAGMKPVVVASRNPANARRLAAELGAEAADYAAAAAHPGVAAAYVATPPSEHEAHARLAIGAGRAALIEKPFALDAAAAGRIADAARAAGVFCMEAMWTRFLPLPARLKAMVDADGIGALRGFHGAFFGADAPDSATSLYDPARGGGALMHRGIYPLSLARWLLGPVEEIRAMARIGETGVDEDCALTLRHVSGAVSTLRASLRTGGENEAWIHGEQGVIRVHAPIYRPFAAELRRVTPRHGTGTGDAGGGGRIAALKETGAAQALSQRLGPLVRSLRGGRLRAPFAGNGYRHEAEAVRDALRAGLTESPVMPLAESVEIMELVDAARATWGKGRET